MQDTKTQETKLCPHFKIQKLEKIQFWNKFRKCWKAWIDMCFSQSSYLYRWMSINLISNFPNTKKSKIKRNNTQKSQQDIYQLDVSVKNILFFFSIFKFIDVKIK